MSGLRLSPSQTAILDTMRLVGVVAEAAFAVCLVFAVVAVEILNMAVALERQNVRRDTIQKPAIVRNYDSAAAEVFE